jgi:hypothetical protein
VPTILGDSSVPQNFSLHNIYNLLLTSFFQMEIGSLFGAKKKQTNFISTKTSNVRVYSWIISLLHTIQYTTLAHVSTDEVRKRCGCLFTVYHNFSQQALRI